MFQERFIASLKVRERERERETERETDRHTDRQTDRQKSKPHHPIVVSAQGLIAEDERIRIRYEWFLIPFGPLKYLSIGIKL